MVTFNDTDVVKFINISEEMNSMLNDDLQFLLFVPLYCAHTGFCRKNLQTLATFLRLIHITFIQGYSK